MNIRCATAIILTFAAAACGSNSPSSPSSPSAPPAPTAPIRYTALGASDANGVGGSTPCLPLTPCENGTGYVPTLARLLRNGREVNVVNLGIPAAVLSPAMFDLGRRFGRDIPANFIARELPFVPAESTLITVLGGPNDVNALGEAVLRGAAGNNEVRGFLDSQIRAFGADYDRLVQGLRSRAPGALIVLINIPNMAALPYAAGQSLLNRQGLQYISVGFTREINRQAGSRIVVVDAMCDSQSYAAAFFSTDGFHPNDAGYNYLAQRLLTVVNTESSSTSSSCAQMSVVAPL